MGDFTLTHQTGATNGRGFVGATDGRGFVGATNGRGSVGEAIVRARADLRPSGPWFRQSPEAEGGCGVTGFACTIPVGGKHIYEPSIQMRNRGNGKGGGIAACGLVPEEMGVSRKVLEDDYILQVALLDPQARGEVEKRFIEPYFDIDQGGMVSTVSSYRDVPLLDVRPPDVARYFVRVKPAVLAGFAAEKKARRAFGAGSRGRVHLPELAAAERGLLRLAGREAGLRALARAEPDHLEDRGFRRSGRAVLLHARHAGARVDRPPRYPTKGRVWHPGGAHPFIGLNEALVHNGDFANYHSVSEYLAGRNIFPQFLTDTEVSVLLFDLWNRVYKYPIEYIVEALAPTTEADFDRLSSEKQRIYRQIQAAHIHASPDGPWFFIIARSLAETKQFQLLGITDTARCCGPRSSPSRKATSRSGWSASEKQAIDATLASAGRATTRASRPRPTIYWNARGGSHTDGGAFLLTVSPNGNGNGSAAKTPSESNGKNGQNGHTISA